MFTKKRWQKLAGILSEQVSYEDEASFEDPTEQGNRKLVGYYETWSPEDVELGDTDKRGELGEWSMEPDEIDLEDGLSAVDLVVKTLQDDGATQASSSHFSPGTWYSTDDIENYNTGERTIKSFHLKGFTPEEEEAVFNAMHGR